MGILIANIYRLDQARTPSMECLFIGRYGIIATGFYFTERHLEATYSPITAGLLVDRRPRSLVVASMVVLGIAIGRLVFRTAYRERLWRVFFAIPH
ncbi:hypothetical protein [Candidatus Amarolinea aalborgensis]|uniref:hypothetical protein n=1 Tax=Candidatus Amarolinea aalborgensis TaxID=2249329 RepID=UPI003BFA0C80